MEAFLQLLSDEKIDTKPLITHSFKVEDAKAAYELITEEKQQPYLGVLIRYSPEGSPAKRLELVSREAGVRNDAVLRIGVLGAGNFALSTLIPAMKALDGLVLEGLCASNGARARSAAEKFKFAFCTSDEDEIFANDAINTIVIATRHHLHAEQVIRAIESGKHVFCEKPLCLTEDELHRIQSAYARRYGAAQLMVGFNRRFAPMAKRMKSFLATSGGPLAMHYRVNAGMLPKDHWINDPEQGGGRILGEVCHFVDFLSFLCDAAPVSVRATAISRDSQDQDVIISLDFADGSNGTVHYLCSGDRVFGKERVEVFGNGAVAVLDDFRRLELARHGKKQSSRSWLRQDKGHRAEWREFAQAIRAGGPSPIGFDEICATTLATIRIADSLRSGQQGRVQLFEERVFAPPLVS